MERLTTRRARGVLARVAALVALSIAAAVLVPAGAQAADADDFVPGFLVSDEDFFKSKSMTSTQADTFIDNKNKGCLPGSVCLENYKESIKAKAATSRCSAIAAATNRTAGQIVTTVGKACGISPKAILVILQKEQSLVTSRAPGPRAFQASMGAGCPDTAPCDGRYAGFYENVYYGASLLKGYTMPGSTHYTRYQAGKTSSIAYSPNSYKTTPTCGFKSVFVQNQATHALYVYTPYTPNSAALKNLYGTGDSCSAYGNRNFWRMWTDWFGPSGDYGVTAIAGLYGSVNGPSSLGAPLGAPEASGAFGGGLLQRYEKGAIAWTETYGAHQMSPAILARWDSAGGAAAMGWPLDNITSATNAFGSGKSQTYDGGLIVWTSGSGTYRVFGAYQRALEAAGGFEGKLGWPIGEAASSAQRFRGGTVVYDSASTKTDILDNRIAPAYLAAGGPTKWGRPTAAIVASTSGVGGVYQDFAKGRVVLATGRPALVVYGAYLSVWSGADSTKGTLQWPKGAPFTDELSGYRAQAFDGGTVYTGAAGKGYVAAVFADTVARNRGVTGGYGFPSTPLRTTTTGVGQDFSGWTLAKTAEGGIHSLTGGLRTAWISYKAEKGVLGWPLTQASKGTDGVTKQTFEGGTIYQVGTQRAYVAEQFVPALTSAGGVTGRWGWPTSQLITSSKNGGGKAQKFKNVVLTWNEERGTVSVWGTLIAPWYSASAYNGALGWPTGVQATDAPTKARYQDFQGGRLYVLGAKNGWVAAGFEAAFDEAGGLSGTWGWPSAPPTLTNGVTTQSFANGTAKLTGETVTFTAK